jgi:hypothetical protein
VNVDTAEFTAITELADRQAGELEALREVASRFYEAGYRDAGGPATSRTAYRLGFAAGLRRADNGSSHAPTEDELSNAVRTFGAAPGRHLKAVR